MAIVEEANPAKCPQCGTVNCMWRLFKNLAPPEWSWTDHLNTIRHRMRTIRVRLSLEQIGDLESILGKDVTRRVLPDIEALIGALRIAKQTSYPSRDDFVRFARMSRIANQLRRDLDPPPLLLLSMTGREFIDPLSWHLRRLDSLCDLLAVKLKPKRGAPPNYDRRIFEKSVALTIQNAGVTMTKTRGGKFARVLDVLYEIAGIGPAYDNFDNLKSAVDAVRAQSWTVCDLLAWVDLALPRRRGVKSAH